MYLSAKRAHQPRGLTDHEELELLLESFSKQVEEIVSELETMTVSNQSSFRQSDLFSRADGESVPSPTCKLPKRSQNSFLTRIETL
jgi:hypothetical protein